MSTLTTIQSTDLITNSRADINGNFSTLNSEKLETSVLDTDTTLAANSNSKVPTQAAVKAYVDAGGNVNASETTKGIVEEATDAEIVTGTDTGGTGARLFVTPSKLNTQIGALEKNKKVYISTTEVTFTNGNGGSGAGVEQTCFSTTVTGGLLSTNNAIHFRMYISGANINSTSGAWSVKVKYGGTTHITLQNLAGSAARSGMVGYLDGYIFADGATGAQKITATLNMWVPNDVEEASDAAVGVTKDFFSTSVASGTVDSTTDQTLAISVTMTNSANNDGVMEWFMAELIR